MTSSKMNILNSTLFYKNVHIKAFHFPVQASFHKKNPEGYRRCRRNPFFKPLLFDSFSVKYDDVITFSQNVRLSLKMYVVLYILFSFFFLHTNLCKFTCAVFSARYFVIIVSKRIIVLEIAISSTLIPFGRFGFPSPFKADITLRT